MEPLRPILAPFLRLIFCLQLEWQILFQVIFHEINFLPKINPLRTTEILQGQSKFALLLHRAIGYQGIA